MCTFIYHPNRTAAPEAPENSLTFTMKQYICGHGLPKYPSIVIQTFAEMTSVTRNFEDEWKTVEKKPSTGSRQHRPYYGGKKYTKPSAPRQAPVDTRPKPAAKWVNPAAVEELDRDLESIAELIAKNPIFGPVRMTADMMSYSWADVCDE